MKLTYLKQIFWVLFGIGSTMVFTACSQNKGLVKTSENQPDTISVAFKSNEIQFIIDFQQGKSHNHPTFAFWLEDLEGNYLQTLFVTQSIAKGIYAYADAGDGTWKNKEGKAYRPAALPIWQNKKAELKADVDAVSGATPKGNFVLKSWMANSPKKKINLLMEINQPWDWNKYWTNNKYPDNQNYKTSCQPSLLYQVSIDLSNKGTEYYLNPVGHGHYAGDNGNLYTDLTTFTTALNITKSVKVRIE